MTTPTTETGRALQEWPGGDERLPEYGFGSLTEAILAIEAEARAEATPPPLDVERVMEWLHDLDGTQHYITHETSYDGDDMESVECATGVEGHREDAMQLFAALGDKP